jgi:hypothetical protein
MKERDQSYEAFRQLCKARKGTLQQAWIKCVKSYAKAFKTRDKLENKIGSAESAYAEEAEQHLSSSVGKVVFEG